MCRLPARLTYVIVFNVDSITTGFFFKDFYSFILKSFKKLVIFVSGDTRPTILDHLNC